LSRGFSREPILLLTAVAIVRSWLVVVVEANAVKGSPPVEIAAVGVMVMVIWEIVEKT